MIRTLLFSLFGMFLTGCMTLTPPITEYTISFPSQSSNDSLSPKSSLTLKISGTKTTPSLSSKALFYLTDRQEVGAYLYSRWNDAPNTLIDRSLTASMEERQLFAALIPKTSAITADLVLESTLSSFYHRIHEDDTSDAYVDITYLLIDQKNKKTVASKRFLITLPAPSKNALGGVSALNHATHELTSQCTAWLNLTMKENKWIK